MPIGVPKVPYRLPGEEDASYVDIYNLLYRERILFLAQAVDDDISNQLVAIMVYLNAEDEKRDMFMYINSPGGSVLAGLAVFDTMEYVQPDVTTICMGMAMSMGSFVLAGGEFGKRIAMPHSRVMIHQPSSAYYDGQAGEFLMEANEVLRIRDEITRIYSIRTGQPRNLISEDLERDSFMSAEEAKEYGVVDQVVASMEAVPWAES
uniref:proteolytic subunit 2 of clp protease n=1 Tax=Interfilum massjukiae TaxID=519236 RepID=UPI00286A6B87|nr:proteolytic subunit 2 of clp protease [Interfilum massjukiae]WKT06071.1 proteolytic subunit 2 of clp protease [Interfilum massjukiae]WKT06170.1 proteolytic subunit 2 of clp protease [Interfilum sp. SAG 36.88]